MRAISATTMLCALFLGLSLGSAFGDIAEDNWPNWRGPNSDGVAVKGNPPIKWSETQNIKWKIDLPGGSDSTPVIWGDKLFIQVAVPVGKEKKVEGRSTNMTNYPSVPYEFKIICFDRNNGKTLWEKVARKEVPHEGHHPHSSLSSYSPVTDGELLWVSFGSRGLHCYDLDGNHKWSKDIVKMSTINSFGEGSSPALIGDAIIVVADHEGDSKIYAFDKVTGDLRWEKDRDEETGWATPRGVEVNGTYQVIVSGTNRIRSYDAETGEELWQCSGLTSAAIPTPLIGFGKAYLATGYGGFAMLAIDLDHKGDLSASDAIAWQADHSTPYVSSPLLYEDKIYMVKGVRSALSCFDAQTGKIHYEGEKIDGMKIVYASPTAVDGRIYISDRKGNTAVIKHSDKFQVLALNSLDDSFDASPVIVGDNLYLKGDKHLYCIAKK